MVHHHCDGEPVVYDTSDCCIWYFKNCYKLFSILYKTLLLSAYYIFCFVSVFTMCLALAAPKTFTSQTKWYQASLFVYSLFTVSYLARFIHSFLVIPVCFGYVSGCCTSVTLSINQFKCIICAWSSYEVSVGLLTEKSVGGDCREV